MKKNTTPVKMLGMMLLSIVLTLLFYFLYHKTKVRVIGSAASVFLVVSLHFIIMHLCAPIVFMVFRKKHNYRSIWFQHRKFEDKLFKILKVRKWKNKLATYDASEFALQENSLEEVIMNMCHAEVVHEVIVVASFLPVLLAGYGMNGGFLFVSSLLFALSHLSFIVIQRYNRPRVIKLLEYGNRN